MFTEKMHLVVAVMWKEICIFAPLAAVGLGLILIVMIALKQIFGISTKQLVKRFIGGVM